MRWMWARQPPPKIGDDRVRSGFLWFPKVIGNEVRWWCSATWREEYKTYYAGSDPVYGIPDFLERWTAVKWID